MHKEKRTNILTLFLFQAWIACFDAWDGNVMYSGGDDCRLTCCDLRVTPSSAPAASRSSAHDAGVTCLQSSAKRQHVLLSGSFDERLLEWDTRRLLRPVREARPGGGIWRIKENPTSSEDHLIALACTDGGFKVVGSGSLATVAHNGDHESLAYGVDWRCNEQDEQASYRLASCSFYDHLLTLWSLEKRLKLVHTEI